MKQDELIMNALNHYYFIFTALYVFNFAITIACLSPLSFHKGLPKLCKIGICASCCKRNFFSLNKSVVSSQIFKYLLHCSFS